MSAESGPPETEPLPEKKVPIDSGQSIRTPERVDKVPEEIRKSGYLKEVKEKLGTIVKPLYTLTKTPTGGEILNCKPWIGVADKLATEFREKHDIATLLTINTGNEAEESWARRNANIDRAVFCELLKIIKEIPSVTKEEYTRLRNEYVVFMNAVGFINGITGIVDHTRLQPE